MPDTKITRLRNLLGPVANYFKLIKTLETTKFSKDVEKKIKNHIEKELKNTQNNLPEILKIVKEIPDNACE